MCIKMDVIIKEMGLVLDMEMDGMDMEMDGMDMELAICTVMDKLIKNWLN